MINLPPAEIDDAAFANCCESLPPDVKERIAGAFPSYFTAAFVFPGGGVADVRPASPGPAKAREPKATPTVDKASLDAAVLARVADLPDQRSATIAAFLYDPARHGDDDKRFGDLVRASLTRLVTAGKVYQDGTRKNARFKAKAAPAHQEDGGTEAT